MCGRPELMLDNVPDLRFVIMGSGVTGVLVVTCRLVATQRDRWQALIRPKRGFCQTCGYDLTGNTTGTCPECGTTVEGTTP